MIIHKSIAARNWNILLEMLQLQYFIYAFDEVSNVVSQNIFPWLEETLNSTVLYIYDQADDFLMIIIDENY